MISQAAFKRCLRFDLRNHKVNRPTAPYTLEPSLINKPSKIPGRIIKLKNFRYLNEHFLVCTAYEGFYWEL